MMRQYELVDRVKRYNPSADEALLNRAYIYARVAHGNQKRASGDPFFGHPLEVAAILTDLKLDEATIAAAVLHDAEETLEIYAPLAGRMGIQEMREELEDLAFQTLNPEAYETISRHLRELTAKSEKLVGQIERDLLAKLEAKGLVAEVKGRQKRPYS